MDSADVSASEAPAYITVRDSNADEDIIDYEKDNGTMLEQSVSIQMLVNKADASETVAALFFARGTSFLYS